MKLKKSLVNQYNYLNSLIVITSYPAAGGKYGQNQDAVASFAKNRLLALKPALEQSGGKLIVITDYQEKPETYIEEGILVIRAYKKNHPLTYGSVLKLCQTFGIVRQVMVEFEFATFGQTIVTSLFPLMLALLKLQGKSLTIELHQVLADLGQLSGHLGHTKGSLKNKFFSFGLKAFYNLLGRLADNLVVLEPELKNRLELLTGRQDIAVIPHGVDQNLKAINTKVARRKLGLKNSDFVVLNFGFVTWYKGSDFLVNTFARSKKLKQHQIKLIMAGGPSYNQKNKPHYQKYYEKTAAVAKNQANILHTGFVAEKDLPFYFAAADAVVLPYRTFMSSSGPLSLALSYGKPFILSDKLSSYCEGSDFQEAFKTAQLPEASLLFALNSKALEQKLLELKINRRLLNKIELLAKNLARRRSFSHLANSQLELVFNQRNNFQPGLAFEA